MVNERLGTVDFLGEGGAAVFRTHAVERGRVVAQLGTRTSQVTESVAEQAEAERLAQAETEAAAAAAAEAARQEAAARPLRLNQAQINEAIATQADPLRACITEELARDPRLAQVRITFLIENVGRAVNLTYAPNSEEFTSCMAPIMQVVEFPEFRTRRQRAMFTISIRGSEATRATASADLPANAPWWAFNQARAEASGGGAPASERGWWMNRPPPAVNAPTPAATPATATTPSTSLWWMQRQPTPDVATPATGEETASTETEPANAEQNAQGEETASEGSGEEAAPAEGETATSEGESETDGETPAEETPAEETPAEETPEEEVPWWLPQE